MARISQPLVKESTSSTIEKPTARLERVESGGYQVHGDMIFSTVGRLYQQPFETPVGSTVDIDVSSVSRMDSAGVAMMVEWMNRAMRAGGECRFLGLNSQGQSMLSVLDLEALLTPNSTRE